MRTAGPSILTGVREKRTSILPFVQFFTLGQFARMAIYPAALFTSSVRSTATSFAFNSSRLFGFLGPILAGSIITKLGGYPRTTVTFGLIYLLGLAVIPFIPETKGHPLPD
jgi:hypothetical protein